MKLKGWGLYYEEEDDRRNRIIGIKFGWQQGSIWDNC